MNYYYKSKQTYTHQQKQTNKQTNKQTKQNKQASKHWKQSRYYIPKLYVADGSQMQYWIKWICRSINHSGTDITRQAGNPLVGEQSHSGGHFADEVSRHRWAVRVHPGTGSQGVELCAWPVDKVALSVSGLPGGCSGQISVSPNEVVMAGTVVQACGKER